ncbi:hypothetical protein Scel_83460 [Streptomyces cellostaticus]|uniref:hypothetical protein n=1 Tax=Streptomyces cellostaticus TaxID=67285 RepID=UPI0025CB08BF|nr:hypothetical protein [Streptomyces cellostaticus]GHI10024.1 hypothetical protein Scel_83450 [Streptomyces cellostaticus]GHI10025.1 hypothetical protein Scel_83460 [Streptomyces cellostaticus]
MPQRGAGNCATSHGGAAAERRHIARTSGSAFGPRAAVAGGGALVVAVMLALAAAVPALRRYRV